jgi:hypothetical protein
LFFVLFLFRSNHTAACQLFISECQACHLLKHGSCVGHRGDDLFCVQGVPGHAVAPLFVVRCGRVSIIFVSFKKPSNSVFELE